MFSRNLTTDTVSNLLDFESTDDFVLFMLEIGQESPDHADKIETFSLKDALILKLAASLLAIGVDRSKALSYSEAVLGSHLAKGWNDFQELIEDDNQELYCLIEDSQLARIFLRAKDDGREFDIGAVKPVLLPTTRCEINVCRAIRPVIYRAQK